VKGLIAAPWVQGLLARLIAAYEELVIATLRWRLVDFEPARAAIAADEGLIGLFWHGRIAQAIACRPLLGTKPRRVMISHSRDGAFIALAAERLGIPTIRGSTGRADDALAKGGAVAFRAAVKTIAERGAVLLTPDGPRGPAQVMPTGPVQLARAARCPVFALGLAARPALSFKTWDGARVPLPFARAVLVIAGPFRAPVRMDEHDLEAARANWQEAMNAAQARAEAILAGGPARRTLGLHLYSLAGRLGAPLTGLWLRRRLARGQEDPVRWREKLGVTSAPRPPGRLVWLHGVSVGESLALLPLAEAVIRERPGAGLLVTSATRASAEFLKARLPRGAVHQFAPLDTPPAVRRFLDHWRPDLGVLAESDLWPNLILAAKARGARLALLSARLSDSSLQGWRRAPDAARAVLASFDLILARDAAADEGLRSLGGRVDGLADLKYGAPPLPADLHELSCLKRALGGRLCLLAASTHPGEDGLVLDAFHEARGPEARGLRADAILVIAPRHPERGPEIETLAAARGLRVGRRAAGADPCRLDVYVADTVGELGLFYRLANLAVIGGSLIAGGAGGHNPLEPARLRTPFIAGPHVNAWPVYSELAAAGATRLVSPRDLTHAFRLAEGDIDALDDMAARARAFVEPRDRAAAAAMAPVLNLLPP
jgi:3-deoxy-D-manno-octulosonic-acid transferase